MSVSRLVLFCVVILAGCAQTRATVEMVPEGEAPGAIESIFIGTTRAPDPNDPGRLGSGRSPVMRYGRVDVSVPPDRTPGTIPLPDPRGERDTRTQFLAADLAIYSGPAEFRRKLAGELARTNGEAVLFVHGYNNNFAEGTYRLAQLAHDLKLPETRVHYSWPSYESVFGYAYDRDSAIFASGGLAELIEEVEAAGGRRVFVIAHSMGGLITMEALSRLALQGKQRVLGRVSAVVLMSPDIDVDVFKAEAATIGNLPQPFMIVTSLKDRALALSATMTGQTNRLGNVADPAQLAELKVTLIDTTAFSVGGGHFNVAESPALLSIINNLATVDNALAGDGRARAGLVGTAALTVQNVTQIVLAPVTQ